MNVGPLPPQDAGDPSAFGSYPYQASGHGGPISTSQQAFKPGAGYNHGAIAAMASAGTRLSYPQTQADANQHPSSTAPYSHTVPAQAPRAPTPTALHHFHEQQQASRQSQSASPQQHQSPNAGSQRASVPPKQHTPPYKYPMAAPPLPQSPANQQSAAHNASPSPQTPQSPESQNREQQRVQLLLDINLEMLEEVNRLQAEGKGGAITVQQQQQLKAQEMPAELASEEYIQVLRRIQANLGYLMPVAQGDASKTPRGPVYMSPPPHMAQLQHKYDQLRELFPEWQGVEHRGSQQATGSPHLVSGANGFNTSAGM